MYYDSVWCRIPLIACVVIACVIIACVIIACVIIACVIIACVIIVCGIAAVCIKGGSSVILANVSMCYDLTPKCNLIVLVCIMIYMTLVVSV